MRRASEHLTALDWIAVVLATLLAVALLAIPPFVAPAFDSMFAEFGSVDPLPWPTQLVMQWWFPMSLSLCSFAPVVVAVLVGRGTMSIGIARLLIVTGFLVALLAISFCLYSFYLPVLEISDAIQTC